MTRRLALTEAARLLRSPGPPAWAGLFLAAASAWTLLLSGTPARGLAPHTSFLQTLAYLLPLLAALTAVALWRTPGSRVLLPILLTLPLRDHEPVLARTTAGLLFLAATLLLSLHLPLLFAPLAPPDPGQLAAGLLGLLLFALLLLSWSTPLLLRARTLPGGLLASLLLSYLALLLPVLLSPLPLPSGLAAFLTSLSPAAHLLRLTGGLLDLRDIAYFLGGSALGLVWAVRTFARLRGPVRPPRLLPLAVLALLLTLHGLLTPLSLDLTADRRHTLSPTTRTLLSRLSYPLTITYYTSRRLASLSPTPSEVEDLLRLYTRGNPRIRVKIETVDERRMDVEDLGIVPQQIQITEAGEVRYLTVYSGLSLTYLDRVWILPVVYSVDRLEYELACGLRALLEDRRPVVGILARTPGDSYQTTYRNLVGVAARTFGVRAVDPASTSPGEIDLLLVIDDGRLTEEDIRFVLTAKEAGIPLMLCADAVRVDPDAGFRAGRVEGSPLLALLAAWGVEVEPALVAQRPGLLLPVVEEGESSSVRTLHPYPLWWEVPLPGMPHPITSVLRSLHLYWASPLTLTDAWRPLLLSTPEAWLVTDPLTASPTSGRVTSPPSDARRGPFVLAAVTEGPPRILVLGDAEAGSDLVEFTHAVGNLDFFLASFHWLLGQEDMLTLVTRTRTVPLLDLPEESDRARTVLYVLDVLAVGVVPGLFLLLSFVLALRRPHAED